jgi:hypothetical protein
MNFFEKYGNLMLPSIVSGNNSETFLSKELLTITGICFAKLELSTG